MISRRDSETLRLARALANALAHVRDLDWDDIASALNAEQALLKHIEDNYLPEPGDEAKGIVP